ncbi:Chromo domain containing protein, partial [Trema orientale]
RLHPVFHVSQLKRAIGIANSSWEIPQQLTAELTLEVEPEMVTAVRKTPTGQAEVLITWKDMPPSEATWESFDKIQQQFPAFHLEDKVLSLGGSNDRPPIRFTYVRRSRRS